MKGGAPPGAATRSRAANSRSVARWRWLRRIVAGAVVVLLLHAVGVTVALNTGAVQAAFAATDTVKIDFAGGWSLWPGHVHVREVVVRAQDRNVQFVLRMARADVTVVLHDLFFRRFHAARVRGDGVSFRFRHRLAPESASADFVRALPQLEGFSDPPLVEAGPPAAPLAERDYELWTVQMDDVDVELRELWAQMVRYEGKARARGTFHLRPAKWVAVGPATLDLLGGVLTSGPHTLLTNVAGAIDCEVRGFDVEPVHGMDVFRFISSRVSLRAAVPDFASALFWAGDLAPWSVQGAGTLSASLALRDGVVAPGGEARLSSEHLRLAHAPSGYGLDAKVDLALSSPSAERRASLTATLDRVGLRHGSSDVLPLQVAGLAGWADVTSVEAAESWGVAGAGIALGELRIADLAASRAVLPAQGPRFGSGEATGHAQAMRDAHGVWSGSLGLDVAKASLTVSAVDVRADARLTGTFERSPDDRARASFRVEIPAFAARSGDLHATTSGSMLADYVDQVDGAASWTGELTLGKVKAYEGQGDAASDGDCPWGIAERGLLSGAWQRPARGEARAQLAAKLDDVRLTWGELRGAMSGVDLTARSEASAEGPRLVAGRLAARALSLKNAGGAPSSWQADARTVSAEGHLDANGSALIGPVHLAISSVTGQLGATRLAGDVDAAFQLASRRTANAVRLTGDVRARNVAVATAGRSVENWWANVRVSQAEVRVGHHVDLRAAVQASVQNALPALNVLTSTDDLPSWLPAALPLESLSLVADVDRYCGLTDVSVREAKGGPLAAKGRLQLEPGDSRGAILVTLPAVVPLSVGFEFAKDSANTSPIVGDSWLDDHTRPMDQAMGRKRAQVCAPPPPKCQ